MEAKQLRLSLQKMYSKMDYYQFCDYMGLNPDYDQKYWEKFRELSSGIAAFDDDNLQKIIDYSLLTAES